jgi:hypothetical protein
MKAARVFQLTALALVVVSAVQAGYWLVDQRSYAIEKVQSARTLYQQQINAAQALLDGGANADRVQHLPMSITRCSRKSTSASTSMPGRARFSSWPWRRASP